MRRDRDRLLGLRCLIVCSLLPAAAARAHHTAFFYQLDSAHVVGNANGGAGCAEPFDTGLNGWAPVLGNPQASGGLVTFQNPGVHGRALLPFYDLVLDREDIAAPFDCELVDGGGDATLVTEWVNHLPALPGGFQGQMLVYSTSAPNRVEAIGVSLVNFDGTVAAEFAIPPGLAMMQGRLLLDTSNPNNIVLAQPTEFQRVAIAEADVTGAVNQRIYLRQFYDESEKTVVASYSLDGEVTWQSPFTPYATAFSSAGRGRLWATGDPMTPTTAGPVPALPALAILLLAGLLAAVACSRLRRA